MPQLEHIIRAICCRRRVLCVCGNFARAKAHNKNKRRARPPVCVQHPHTHTHTVSGTLYRAEVIFLLPASPRKCMQRRRAQAARSSAREQFGALCLRGKCSQHEFSAEFPAILCAQLRKAAKKWATHRELSSRTFLLSRW